MRSMNTPLLPHEYGILPIAPGLLIAGTPIGNDDFIRQSLAAVIHDSVIPTFNATTSLKKSQVMNLLVCNICGTSRVQHLWQTIRPSFTTSFAKEVDHLTQNTILTIMGLIYTTNKFSYPYVLVVSGIDSLDISCTNLTSPPDSHRPLTETVSMSQQWRLFYYRIF
jgi:hypothetical protein